MKKWLKMISITMTVVVIIGFVGVLSVNAHVKSTGKSRLMTVDEVSQLDDVDCIIVLGCQVRADGSLSDMLHDRLARGVEVYHVGASGKLLMSGDHGRTNYDEVGAMKRFAVENEVPSEDVFMDHAGFSTYETIYRAKEIFQAKKVVVVTQEYHLYRAIYIAEQLGLDAYGVSADLRSYRGQVKRDFREVLARCKDFGMCIFKPEPTYLGEAIPVSGNGDVTNDE
jgi:vancomycin permeability regulator SanA